MKKPTTGKEKDLSSLNQFLFFFYFFLIIDERSGSFSSITEVGAAHLSEPAKEVFRPRGRRSRFRFQRGLLLNLQAVFNVRF